ncbi:hypothetical protein AcW1_007390 [Taiwanofungus camphoratus]|nr:hypothetical protein AcW1_007390 [Antrodia cinnamomea]
MIVRGVSRRRAHPSPSQTLRARHLVVPPVHRGCTRSAASRYGCTVWRRELCRGRRANGRQAAPVASRVPELEGAAREWSLRQQALTAATTYLAVASLARKVGAGRGVLWHVMFVSCRCVRAMRPRRLRSRHRSRQAASVPGSSLGAECRVLTDGASTEQDMTGRGMYLSFHPLQKMKVGLGRLSGTKIAQLDYLAKFPASQWLDMQQDSPWMALRAGSMCA